MSGRAKIYYLLLIILLFATSATYIKFQVFKPLVTSQNQNILEANDKRNDVEFFYPTNYEKIGISETSQGTQITIKTLLSSQDIQIYYKDLLISKGWEVEYENVIDSFIVTKYKSKKGSIVITSSKQESDQTTIVSVDIKNNF